VLAAERARPLTGEQLGEQRRPKADQLHRRQVPQHVRELGAIMDCISSRMVLVARNGGLAAGAARGAGSAEWAWQPTDKAATTSNALRLASRMHPH